jgi:hypothetical protein
MKYYKVTIEIITDFDPSCFGLETLAQDATSGDSICTSKKIVEIKRNKLPGAAKNFFISPDDKD